MGKNPPIHAKGVLIQNTPYPYDEHIEVRFPDKPDVMYAVGFRRGSPKFVQSIYRKTLRPTHWHRHNGMFLERTTQVIRNIWADWHDKYPGPVACRALDEANRIMGKLYPQGITR